MWDDSLIEVTGKGKVEIDHVIFQSVLHVPQFSVNLLLVYHITHSGLGNNVEFTPNSVSIFDIQDNSRIVVGEVNHQSHLYTFSKFV